MGQQQLILLVLATVIVGIAIVVGITAFSENADRSNADAMMHDAVRIANDVQASLEKPTQFGGVDTFADVDFAVLGYANDGTYYANLNGAFELTDVTASGVQITGYGGDGVVTQTTDADGNTTQSVDKTVAEQQVVVAVCGPEEGDISSAVTQIGGQGTGVTDPPSC